jgi:hypothetical protein
VKNQRDPSKWSNVEIEQDSEGYVEAQAAYREDREQAETQRREQDDLRLFEEEFVRAGGKRSEAARRFREQRDRDGAEAASRASASVLQDARRRIRKVL